LVVASGGFKVGGPEARLKGGHSDNVIILSQLVISTFDPA